MRAVLEDDCNTLEGDLPAAVEWVKHAGQLLVESRQEYPSGNGHGDPARGGKRWKGKKGFCTWRWELWLKRFEELSKEQNGVRDLAAQAASEMRRLLDERDARV